MKAISSLGVRSPCRKPLLKILKRYIVGGPPSSSLCSLSAECEDFRGIGIESFINCIEKIHGDFAIHKAASDGDLHLVQYLHQNGANLTAKVSLSLYHCF